MKTEVVQVLIILKTVGNFQWFHTQTHIASLWVCMLMHTSKTQDLSIKGPRGLWNLCKLLSRDSSSCLGVTDSGNPGS